jgi:hypothetical protein
MIYWSVSDLHIDRSTAIWETPLPLIMLMLRENQRTINKNGMSLQDKDAIDEMNKRERKNG